MKRILISCFFLLALVYSNKFSAQPPNYSLTASAQCYSGAAVPHTVGAVITVSVPGAASYSWAITPGPGVCAQSSSLTAPTGTSSAFTFTCCGIYTINCFPWTAAGVLIPGIMPQQTFEIVCPGGGTLNTTSTNTTAVAGSSAICIGNSSFFSMTGTSPLVSATLIAKPTGGATFTVGTGNPIQVTPTINTTYTMIATTAIGCTVANTQTLIVQNASIGVTPSVAINRCVGEPISLSSTLSAINNGSYSAGTQTTGIQWFEPAFPPPVGPPIASVRNTTAAAASGSYIAVLTHTGAAGTCAISKSVVVNTIATIPVTITASGSALSGVCPGNNFTLNANPQFTSTATYTWSVPPVPTTFNTKTLVQNITTSTTFTVDVNYYGCTGNQTVLISILSITPSLVASNALTTPLFSTCPSQSLMLTMGNAVNYTLTALPNGGGSFVLPGASNSTTRTHTPLLADLPITYSVNANQNGCVGSTTVQVGLLALNTVLSSSISAPSGSACPNTSVVLNTNNGPGTINTYSSQTFLTNQTSTTTGAPNTSSVTFALGNLSLPHVYEVFPDSAGCQGYASIVINSLVINPTFTVLPATSSICPGQTISLTSSGGAGTSYTFTSPYPVTGTTQVMPKANATVNTVANFTTPATQTLYPLPYTYTVEVDSAGCKGMATVDIGLYTIMPLVSLSSPSICPNKQFTVTTTGGAGTNYTFTESSSTAASSSVIATGTTVGTDTAYVLVHTPTYTFAPGDANTYTVSVDSLGCKGLVTFSLGILNLSNSRSLSLASKKYAICPGTTITLVADTSKIIYGYDNINYKFLAPASPGPSTIIANTTTNTASYTTGALPITFTVEADSAGCVGSQTLTVTEFFLNNLTIAANPTIVCAGKPVTLTASGVNNNTVAPSVNYTFVAITPTALVGTSNSRTFAVSPGPTIQTVYSVLADSAGCKSPTNNPLLIPTVTVDIKPGLTFTPSSSSPSVCPGLSVGLNVVSSGTANVTFSWTSPPGSGSLSPSTGTNTSFAVANPTTNATYTIDGTDPEGCVGSTVITIGIDPSASLSVTLTASSQTICPPGTGTAQPGTSSTLIVTSPVNPVTYTWSPATSLSNINNDTTVVSNLQANTAYTVTVHNGYGCFGTATVAIVKTNYPIPLINANPQNVCAGFQSTLTAFGGVSYTWTSLTPTAPVFQQSVAVGAGTHSLTLSNGGGCDTKTLVVIGPAPNLLIGVTANGAASATTCIEYNPTPISPYKKSKPVKLVATGATSYVWSPYDPNYMTYSLGVTTDASPPSTTQYTVFGSNSSCTGSAVVNVSVIPQFSIEVIPPLPAMCLGDTLRIRMILSGTNIAVGPVSAFTYSWMEQDAQVITIVGSKISSSITIVPTSNRTYFGDVKDTRGCVSLPGIASVTVLPRPLTALSIPTINNVPTNTLCFVGNVAGAEDLTLDLFGINKNVGLPFGIQSTYTWSAPSYFKDSPFVTPINNSGITVKAPMRTPEVVTFTLTSGYNGIPGCLRNDTISVRVIDCRPVGEVKFSTDNGGVGDTLCVRRCITFVNNNDTLFGGPQTYTWTFDGGSPRTSNEKSPVVCYNLPGKYVVSLMVANPYPKKFGGSEGVKQVDDYVRIVDIPNVTIFSPGQLRSDTTIRFGQQINLTGTGAFSYSWTPNFNISSTNDPKVVIKPNVSTQYILTGYNSKSCFSKDTLNVHVIEDCGEMFVPNAFSPNGDGVNDEIKVYGKCLQTLTFMIFNRWGEKVFETTDIEKGWNGIYNGVKLNTGVFVYRLEGRTHEGTAYNAKGNITLLR